MKVQDLKDNPNNPRTITNEKLQMLKDSMHEFGDLSGIVKNNHTDRLCGGHQRIKNLDPSWKIEKKPYKDDTGTVAIGHINTPFGLWQYREVDWDENKEYAANIAANKHGGEFDFPKLKDILEELDNGAFNMDLTGFDSDEIEQLMTQYHVETEKDKKGIEFKKVYEIIVKCKDEKDQQKIYENLREKGYECRILTS